MNIILQGVVGSQAYGLAHANSDIDRLGVYVAPLREILSVTGQSKGDQSKVNKTTYGDLTLHEVQKFLRLALQCNPTIMELLWLPIYDVKDSYGEALVGLRHACLSKRAINAYMGYVMQQAQRLVNRGGTFDPDLKKRTEKHGRHCWRLLIQGEKLALTGELTVKLSESEADECRKAGQIAERTPQSFFDYVRSHVDRIEKQGHVLPETPDTDTVNEVLFTIRMANEGLEPF